MPASLRVTMLVKHFPTRQGGAERLLESMTPLLAERGIEVTVIARARQDREPVAEGASVVHVPVRGGRELSAAWYVAGAVSHIRRDRPDVVHAHSLLSPTTVALLAGKTMGIPAVATVHGGGDGGEVQRLRSPKRGGLVRLRIVGRALDRIVVISDEIDAELAAVGVPEDRRVAIPNGVDTDRFHPVDATTRGSLRDQLGLGRGPVVVFVGRLIAGKGVGVLVDAWAKVREVHPDATLVLVGDGPQRSELEARGAPGVGVIGGVDDVLPFLTTADVFVLPSFAEGLSIALLEAMACGLPVVATDVGANRDVLGGGGRLVSPGDAVQLANELVELLADPGLRAELGSRARQSAHGGYQLADTADRLVTLYRSLARRRSASG